MKTIHEQNLSQWEYIRNLEKDEYYVFGYKNNKNVRGWYKCKKCGHMKHCANGKFKRKIQKCEGECRELKEIAHTHPNLVKFFENEKDAYVYTAKSGKTVNLKCPHCSFRKVGKVHNLTNSGFSCPVCSDGISFPERFMANVLREIGFDFVTQYKFNGSSKKYDFYLPSLDVIIEVHGEQHYKDSHRGKQWKSYEEEHENDLFKYDLAVINGYEYNKNYFIINCRRTEWGWIRNSIINSPLNLYIPSDFDWQQIFECSLVSHLHEACKLYEQGKTPVEISRIINKSGDVVRRYLKRGAEIGLCSYNPKEYYQNFYKRVVMLNLETKDIVRIYDSISQCSKDLSYDAATLSSLARGSRGTHMVNSEKLGGVFAFYYLDSEEWEQAKHLYKDTKGLIF